MPVTGQWLLAVSWPHLMLVKPQARRVTRVSLQPMTIAWQHATLCLDWRQVLHASHSPLTSGDDRSHKSTVDERQRAPSDVLEPNAHEHGQKKLQAKARSQLGKITTRQKDLITIQMVIARFHAGKN